MVPTPEPNLFREFLGRIPSDGKDRVVIITRSEGDAEALDSIGFDAYAVGLFPGRFVRNLKELASEKTELPPMVILLGIGSDHTAEGANIYRFVRQNAPIVLCDTSAGMFLPDDSTMSVEEYIGDPSHGLGDGHILHHNLQYEITCARSLRDAMYGDPGDCFSRALEADIGTFRGRA
ncbi:MAG: hypothetical protein MJZ21_03150 [archaeon]|nr:hypothetical protein [archaeon]